MKEETKIVLDADKNENDGIWSGGVEQE